MVAMRIASLFGDPPGRAGRSSSAMPTSAAAWTKKFASSARSRWRSARPYGVIRSVAALARALALLFAARRAVARGVASVCRPALLSARGSFGAEHLAVLSGLALDVTC